jgi:membrane protein DedA with SNARE-associated domain
LLIDIGRWLYELTLTYGVAGLGVGAFAESFGVPTAAIVIDLTAGALIAAGRTSFIKALIVADTGLVLGSLASYYVGKAGAGLVRRSGGGRYRRAGSSRAQFWIERYGDKAVLFGQLFGPARTWISYPAGAMGMDVKKFTFYTAVGGAVYCSVIITLSIYFTDIITSHSEILISLFTFRLFLGAVAAAIFIWFAARRLRHKLATGVET